MSDAREPAAGGGYGEYPASGRRSEQSQPVSDAREPAAGGGYGEYPASGQPGSRRLPGSRSERHQRGKGRKSSRRTGKALRSVGSLRGRYVPPALIAAALVVVLGLAYLTRPEAARAGHDAGTERAPVETQVVTCPDSDGPSSASPRISVATSGDAGGEGVAEIQEVDGQEDSESVAVVQKPGTAWYQDVEGKRDALVVRAGGSMAAGMAAEQTARVEGESPGLAGVRCAAPEMSFWFVGLGPSTQDGGQLYLTNVDATTATVDVDVFTAEGMVDPAGGRSITVKPYSQQVVPIDELVPNTRLATLHVRTTIGRVSASAWTRTETPSGVDWIPDAQEPATELVVPGLPKGNDDRQLLLVAPGNRDATVKVNVVTSGGTYVPEGRETVQVPAGSTMSLDLAAGLSGRASAVRLTSDVPITAGAFAAKEVGVGASDVAFTAATPALDGMSVVADNRAGDGRTSALLLSAPEADAQVRVSTVTPEGVAGKPAMVRIPRGRTVSVKVPAPRGSGDGFAVVAAPRAGSGPVYGARLLEAKVSGGKIFTVLPLVTARTWVTVPAVGDSLSAVIAPH